MEFVLLSALTLVNLLLWLVFLVRFKKLFSADDIMTKFRDGMENILKDAERGTALSINVIDEKIREAKAIVAEAERKLALLRHELQSFESGAAFQAQLNLQSAAAAIQGQEKPAAKKGRGKTALSAASKTALSAASKTALTAAKTALAAASKTPSKASAKSAASKAAAAYKQNELPGEDEAYALTGLFKENAQKSLFDAPQITVNQNGDAYGRIPVVSMSDNPIKPKKSFARRVRELADLGKTVEEIADATGHSTTEVQLVLDTSI